MNNNITSDINALLAKPIWQMSGREFCDLTQYAFSLAGGQATPPRVVTKAKGVQALAEELDCSPSQIYKLMRIVRTEDSSSSGGGILRDAIVSRIGSHIVFDVELARTLAEAERKRKEKEKQSKEDDDIIF